MTLAYYLDNLNPFLLRFGHSSFGVRWYGLAYLTGFIVAYFLLKYLIRQGQLQVPADKLPDFVLTVAIFGVLLGGRLGEVFFYEPHLMWTFGPPFPYWGVLQLQEGGMSAHGGIIGVLLAVWFFARRNQYSFLNLGDSVCMVAPIGILFGRIANFINGEVYGHVAHVWWAVQFPTEIYEPPQLKIERHVSMAKVGRLIQEESVHNPATARLLRRDPLHGIVRLAREGHPFVIAQMHKILPPRYPSQLIESFCEGLLLFIICWNIGRRWRKPGMAVGAFITIYPVMRIIGEQFRAGDNPQKIFGHYFSLGEIYSAPMFVIGLIFWIYMARRPVKPAAALAGNGDGLPGVGGNDAVAAAALSNGGAGVANPADGDTSGAPSGKIKT